jgi:hypothetical protein
MEQHSDWVIHLVQKTAMAQESLLVQHSHLAAMKVPIKLSAGCWVAMMVHWMAHDLVPSILTVYYLDCC